MADEAINNTTKEKTMQEFNITGKHISGNAQVFGNAQVSDNARVFDGARVFGDAWVFGNASVFGNAGVFGDAKVSGGVIDGYARIRSSKDLAQVTADGVTWSRFVDEVEGYRTTSTLPPAVCPRWVHDALDAWEGDRG